MTRVVVNPTPSCETSPNVIYIFGISTHLAFRYRLRCPSWRQAVTTNSCAWEHRLFRRHGKIVSCSPQHLGLFDLIPSAAYQLSWEWMHAEGESEILVGSLGNCAGMSFHHSATRSSAADLQLISPFRYRLTVQRGIQISRQTYSIPAVVNHRLSVSQRYQHPQRLAD